MTYGKTSRFAHLFPGSAPRASEEDDTQENARSEDEDTDQEAEDEEEEEKARKARKARKAKSRKAKSSRADDDDTDPDAEDEEDDAKSKRSRKSKAAKKSKARRAEDNDDDDTSADVDGDDDQDETAEDEEKEDQARALERRRGAAIFAAATPETVPLAAQLAFETDIPRKQAINILRGASAIRPVNAAGNLQDRMSAHRVASALPEVPIRQENRAIHPVAQAVLNAAKKARGQL